MHQALSSVFLFPLSLCSWEKNPEAWVRPEQGCAPVQWCRSKILWHLLLNLQVSTASQVRCLKIKLSNFNPCTSVSPWVGICLRTSFSHIRLEQEHFSNFPTHSKSCYEDRGHQTSEVQASSENLDVCSSFDAKFVDKTI